MRRSLPAVWLQAIAIGSGMSYAAETLTRSPAVLEASHVVPLCRTAPEIDGTLDDVCWEAALSLNRFYYRHAGPPKRVHPGRNTDVRLLYDAQNLYVGVHCEEGAPEKLVAVSKYRDRPDWGDDRVELFIDANGNCGHGPVFYLSVNCEGVTCDSVLGGRGGWDPQVTIGTGREERAYVLEMAIPLSEFGKSNVAGERWHLNVGRFHRATYKGATSLVPLNRGTFIMPGHLAPLVFEKPAAVSVVCESRGAMRSDGFLTGRNCAVFQVTNAGPKEIVLELSATSQEADRDLHKDAMTQRCAPGTCRVELHYRIGGDVLTFRVKSAGDGGVLFESTNTVEMLAPPTKMAWRPDDPLYEPLLDRDASDDWRIRGHAIWAHPTKTKGYLLALQCGQEYSRERNAQQFSQAGYHLYISGNWWERYEGAKNIARPAYEWYADKGKLMDEAMGGHGERGWSKPILYGHYHVRGIDKGRYGTGLSSTHGWLPDPINQTAFVESVERTLDKWGSGLWAVSMGDEQFAQNLHWGTKIFERAFEKSKPGSFLRQADREIREQHGFGKFGMPWNLKRSDPAYPYSQRAYITWLQEKVRKVNRQVYELAKQKCPSVYVISEDGTGNAMTHGIEYWPEHAEIASYQVHNTTAEFPMYAYVTKLVRDLCGLRNLMIVPHECDSGYSAGCVGLDDQLALYSQILVGGATAIHSWPAGSGGRNSRPPKAVGADVGYPLGWHCLLKMGAIFNKLPPLRFPDRADTAIFVGSETAKCDPTMGSYRDAFMHLGPLARGWFKFVSETQLGLGRARLGDYKIIYLPAIRYTTKATIKALTDFVRGGGTLVCADPLAFEYGISSASLAAERERLFGVKVKGESSAEEVATASGTLTVYSEKTTPQSVTTDTDTAEVVLKFDTDEPALVVNRVGEGRAYYFALDPFAGTTKDAGWQRYLKSSHEELGGSTGHDIWRFQLPRELLGDMEEPSAPGEACLTGNYAFWYRCEFVDGGGRYNVKLPGHCVVETKGKGQSFPLADGPLTNRRSVLTDPECCITVNKKYRYKWKDFDVSPWVARIGEPDPIAITFAFDRPQRVRHVRLFFAGELPGLQVELSRDGAAWQSVGQIPKRVVSRKWEVLSETVQCAGPQEAESVRLRIPKRSTDGPPLTLSEVEIWGTRP